MNSKVNQNFQLAVSETLQKSSPCNQKFKLGQEYEGFYQTQRFLLIQTAFKSFLPNSVTDSSTVYTVMKALTKKPQQNILLVICDERIIDLFDENMFFRGQSNSNVFCRCLEGFTWQKLYCVVLATISEYQDYVTFLL